MATSCVFVLVHGFCQGGWIWQSVARRLRAAGVEVYAPTLEGCAERGARMRAGITVDSHAREILALLEFEDLHNVVLVGTSTGGMVLQRVLELQTTGHGAGRIIGLALLDALALFPGEVVLRDVVVGMEDAFVRTELTAGIKPETLATLFKQMSPEQCPAAIQRMTPHPIQAIDAPMLLSGRFWSGTIPLAYPPLVLSCTASKTPPRTHIERTIAHLWGGPVVIEQPWDHYFMLAHSEATAALLLDHFAAAPGSAPVASSAPVTRPVVAVLGLGQMGAPIAKNLLRCGEFQVQLFDPREAAMADVAAVNPERAVPCSSTAAAMVGAAVVLVIVMTEAQLQLALLGPAGASTPPPLASCPADATVVIMSTVSTAALDHVVAQRPHQRILDAAMSGAVAAAIKGTLTLLVGGAQADYLSCLPVFQRIADRIYHLGPLGAGMKAKLANNMCFFLNRQTTRETLVMGRALGFDDQQMLHVLQACSGQSFVTESWGLFEKLARDPTRDPAAMLGPAGLFIDDHHFPVMLGLIKDAMLALREGRSHHVAEADLPIFLAAIAALETGYPVQMAHWHQLYPDDH